MSTIFTTFVEENCQSCGLEFKLPSHFVTYRKENGGAFFCPGCKVRWSYTEPEVARLRKKLERQEEMSRMERADRLAAERREMIAKTKLKNIKKRIGAGVCPHCKRSFKQLRRHMESKHKDKCRSE